MAFDMLDEDGDGKLSRLEVLKGLRAKAQARELLQMGAFTDPAEFDAVYKAIDADGSNSIDRREFESYFLRRHAASYPHAHAPYPPSYPPYPHALADAAAAAAAAESARERELRLQANAALRFAHVGKEAEQRRAVDAALADAAAAGAVAAAASPAVAAAAASDAVLAASRLSDHPGVLYGVKPASGSLGLLHSEIADLSAYDEVARGLERAQQRKLGLHADLDALQREMRTVEADILEKHAHAERLRTGLTQHRAQLGSLVTTIDTRLRQIDRDAMLAARPHLRTAERVALR
jgi:hypothetical protein